MSFVDTSIDKATGPKISDMLAGMFTDTPEEKQAKEKLDTATATAEEGIKTGREQRNQQYGAILAEKPPTPPALEDAPEKPPAYQSDSPLKNFGGLATIIGVFGGMLTRQPLVASLKAASSAMSAYHSRNLEDYQQAVEEWKTNADYTSKLVDWRLKAYEAASKQYGDNVAAHQAAIQAIAANTQDDVTLQTLAQKGYAATIDHIDKQRDALLKWDENKTRIEETAKFHESEIQHWKEIEKRLAGGSPAQQAKMQAATKQTDALISQADDLINMIDKNPNVVGGRGLVGGALETAKGVLNPNRKTDQSYQQFETALKAFQTEANLAISGSKYYSSARIAEMNRIIPGLGRFTSAQDARQALQTVKDVLTGAKQEIPQYAIPQAGDVQEGFRFKGGDPGEQANWEAVE